VLSLLPAREIFLVTGVTDMRLSFRGLPVIVENVLGRDPLSGQVFVFCNRRRNRVKILHFDGSGYWVMAKRLEAGTFAWPEASDAALEMTTQELALLLGGIDLAQTKRRRWYSRAAGA
jgi:transposase